MSLKYRTSAGTSASDFTDLVVKVGDTLPIGTEVDYDGQSVPSGWQEVSSDLVVDSIRTKNLFNKNAGTDAYLGETGKTYSNPDHRVSEFIDISNMSSITISGSQGTGLENCFYDSSKTFISHFVLSSASTTQTVPNNAKYIRITTKKTALDTYQLEEGSAATEYRPYQELDNQEVYSTLETRIGTWIDGKPLYRKVVKDTLPNTDTNGTFAQKNISISSLNCDSKFIESGFIRASIFQSVYELPINSASFDNVTYRTVVNFWSNDIEVRNSVKDWNGADVVISLLYTKTTD